MYHRLAYGAHLGIDSVVAAGIHAVKGGVNALVDRDSDAERRRCHEHFREHHRVNPDDALQHVVLNELVSFGLYKRRILTRVDTHPAVGPRFKQAICEDVGRIEELLERVREVIIEHRCVANGNGNWRAERGY